MNSTSFPKVIPAMLAATVVLTCAWCTAALWLVSHGVLGIVAAVPAVMIAVICGTFMGATWNALVDELEERGVIA